MTYRDTDYFMARETGFGDRVLAEVKRLAPQKDVKLKIYAPPERKVSLFWSGILLTPHLSILFLCS